jgi:hypothetical protein
MMAESGVGSVVKIESGTTPNTAVCQRCGADLGGTDLKAEIYPHGGLRLCEDCYIDLWRPHHRKPHWCYLKSIKGDYLKPSPVV